MALLTIYFGILESIDCKDFEMTCVKSVSSNFDQAFSNESDNRVAHRYNEKFVLSYVERYLINKLTVKNVSYVFLCCELFSLDPRLKQGT